jgi:N-dimethylarginine dimethylaminohydrolase
MKNSIDDLRDHLFATLEALRDEDKPMDIARAKAVAEVADALIASAKVEVDYIRATDQMPASAFFRDKGARASERPALTNGSVARIGRG